MSAGAQIECAGAKAWFCLREYLIHAFLGRLLPAERRERRDNPTFAYATQRSASGFLSLRGNSGLTIDKRRANSLFPRAALRCRVKKAKAWFCLFQVFKERWRVYNSPARRGARVPAFLICHPDRAKRAEGSCLGRKSSSEHGKRVCLRYANAQDFSARSLALPVPSVEMTKWVLICHPE